MMFSAKSTPPSSPQARQKRGIGRRGVSLGIRVARAIARSERAVRARGIQGVWRAGRDWEGDGRGDIGLKFS